MNAKSETVDGQLLSEDEGRGVSPDGSSPLKGVEIGLLNAIDACEESRQAMTYVAPGKAREELIKQWAKYHNAPEKLDALIPPIEAMRDSSPDLKLGGTSWAGVIRSGKGSLGNDLADFICLMIGQRREDLAPLFVFGNGPAGILAAHGWRFEPREGGE